MLFNFDEIIERVIEHEGGYVNDPDDAGGKTNWGISERFYPTLDILNLTKEQAKEIYKRDYWDKNRVEELPYHLRHIFFDMCVNQGRRTAVKILQRATNSKGKNLKVDGGMGPATLKAIEYIELERVRAYRIKYYADLVTSKPEQDKFYFGWFRRSMEV